MTTFRVHGPNGLTITSDILNTSSVIHQRGAFAEYYMAGNVVCTPAIPAGTVKSIPGPVQYTAGSLSTQEAKTEIQLVYNGPSSMTTIYLFN